MSPEAERLLSELMKLPERIEIGARLLDDGPYEVDADYDESWAAEIAERMRQLDSGEVKAIPWEDARKWIEGGGRIDDVDAAE